MTNWLTEVWFVFCLSKKTQFAAAFGFLSFFAILLAGEMLVADLTLPGQLSPLSSIVSESLLQRYDKAAWMSLGSFLLLAFKSYRKDRIRLFAL